MPVHRNSAKSEDDIWNRIKTSVKMPKQRGMRSSIRPHSGCQARKNPERRGRMDSHPYRRRSTDPGHIPELGPRNGLLRHAFCLSALMLVSGCTAFEVKMHSLPCGDPLPGYTADQCHCSRPLFTTVETDAPSADVSGHPQQHAATDNLTEPSRKKPPDVVACSRPTAPELFCVHGDGTQTPGNCTKAKT